jgi:hypothetical protein
MPRGRFVALASLVGVAVGIVMSYPLVLRPGSHVLEDGTLDAFQFVWNVWWVREALVNLHENPFYTRYLFYPEGSSLFFHTLSAPLGLVSIPLQLTLPGGAVTAHNVLVMAAPALAVVTTALLAREVTGDAWAALAGGLVAVINIAMTWFLPVLYLSCTYLVAAALWAWWRLQRRRRAGDVALVVSLLVVLLFASQEYAMMALTLLALDGIGRLTVGRFLGVPAAWVPGSLAVGALAGLAFGVVALVAMQSPAQPLRENAVLAGSGFLYGFVRAPWMVDTTFLRFWFVLYLGTAPLVLLVTTLVYGRGPAVYWMLLLAFVLLMACGPLIGLYHPGIMHPPGASPLTTARIPGPYAILMHFVPLMRVIRAAYRWIAVGHILLGVVIAIGLAGLRRRVPHDGTRRLLAATALGAIVVLGAIDVRTFRAPVAPAVVPPALDVLREDPEPCAIMELPVGLTTSVFANLSSRYMFHQTAHRKYLLDGTLARRPYGVTPLVGRRFASLAEVPWVKYVVIHRELLDVAVPAAREQVAAIDALLAREGTLVRRDGPLEVYRVTTFRAESLLAAGR